MFTRILGFPDFQNLKAKFKRLGVLKIIWKVRITGPSSPLYNKSLTSETPTPVMNFLHIILVVRFNVCCEIDHVISCFPNTVIS